jgi:protein KRI1
VTQEREQRAIRSETIAAFHEAVENDGSDDDLLVLRENTKDELDNEEEEYQQFLTREVGNDIEELITIGNDIPEMTAPNVDETYQKGTVTKGKKKGTDNAKQESDQEFLMKCAACLSPFHL